MIAQLESELVQRGGEYVIEYMPAVDVVVRKRISPDQRDAKGKVKLAEVDELVLLVQQINSYFVPSRLADYTSAIWESTDLLATYKPSHLKEFHQFTGVVRIKFRTT